MPTAKTKTVKKLKMPPVHATLQSLPSTVHISPLPPYSQPPILTPVIWDIMGTAIKHHVPDRVKPSFVIFDIPALLRSELSIRVPGCQKLQTTA